MPKDQQDKDLQSSDDEYESNKDLVQNNENKNQIKSSQGRQQAIQNENIIKNEDLTKYNVFFHKIVKLLNQKIFRDRLIYGKNEQNQHHRQQLNSNKFRNINCILKQLQYILVKQLKQNGFIVAGSFKTSTQQNNNKSSNNNFNNNSSNNKIPFNFKLTRSIMTYQIIEIYCQLGPYSKKFIILNSIKENHIHYCCKNISLLNSQSSVYTVNFNKQNYVVKCISFKGYRKIPLHIILKQLFIASMMSALKIGPQIKQINGFDLCVYPGCAQFAMQMCTPYIHSQINEFSLKLSLLKMHALKIVHNDIKPQNIQYSHKYNKAVFIDFGISQLLSQHIGKKTWTQYCGTMNYSSQEMLRLFSMQKCRINSGYVNLYGNDIFGLVKSVELWGRVKRDDRQMISKGQIRKKQIYQQKHKLSNINVKQDIFHSYTVQTCETESGIGYQQKMSEQLAIAREIITEHQPSQQQKQQQLINTYEQILNKLIIQDQKHSHQHQQQQHQQQSIHNNNSQSNLLFGYENDDIQSYDQLEKQLFTQFTKCILYYWSVYWSLSLQRSNRNQKIYQIIKNVINKCPFPYAQKQIQSFAKTLKREFVQDQIHFLANQIIRINEYNNYINHKESEELQKFYKKAQQQCKQPYYTNKCQQINNQKNNQLQTTYQTQRKQKNKWHTKFNKKELIQILTYQQKSFQNFHYCLDTYINMVIKNITFIQVHDIKSQDKIKIIDVMIMLLRRGQFKKIDENLIGRWFIAQYLKNNDNNNNNENDSQGIQDKDDCNKYLPYRYGMNNQYYAVILFYKNLLAIIIERFPCYQSTQQNDDNINNNNNNINNNNKTNKSQQLKFYQPLISNIFSITKNLIILGFNYYSILKTLLQVAIRYVLSKHNLRKHLILILLKQFIQLGEIMNNYQTIIQITDDSILGGELMFVKEQYLNDQLLLLQQIGVEVEDDMIQFSSQQQKQQVMSKIKVIRSMWIFFNTRYAKANCPENQLFSILKSFLQSLKQQYKQLSARQQFLYYQIYEYQMQVVKDYNITYFNNDSLYEYQRHSGFFMNIKRLYNILWFGEQDSQKYEDSLKDQKKQIVSGDTQDQRRQQSVGVVNLPQNISKHKKNNKEQQQLTSTTQNNATIIQPINIHPEPQPTTGYKRFLNSKHLQTYNHINKHFSTTQQINKFLNHIMFHGLDYYTLTNPTHYYRHNSLSSLQMSLKSMFVIHNIIIESSICLYMYFTLRAKIMLQSNLFAQFAKLVQSFCCVQSPLYLPVETLICLIKDLRSYIEDSYYQKSFDVFQTTRTIWLYAIKILQLMSSKSQQQQAKYNEYFQLKYLQLLQEIHNLFLDLINLQDESYPIKVNFASADMYKHKLQAIFKQFEQNHLTNIKIRIVNKYKIHKIRGLLIRKYEELHLYSQQQRIQCMMEIQKMFVRLFGIDNNKQQPGNIHMLLANEQKNKIHKNNNDIKNTQKYKQHQTLQTSKINFSLSSLSTTTTTTLWRQKLQFIYAQILAQIISHEQMINIWEDSYNVFTNQNDDVNNQLVKQQQQQQLQQHHQDAFYIFSVFFIKKILVTEYNNNNNPQQLLKYILQFIQINYCPNITSTTTLTTNYHKKPYYNLSQSYKSILLQHSIAVFIKFCQLLVSNEYIYQQMIDWFLVFIQNCVMELLGFVFVLLQEVSVVNIRQQRLLNVLQRLLKKVAIRIQIQKHTHSIDTKKYLQQYYLNIIAIKQCQILKRQNLYRTNMKMNKGNNNYISLRRKLLKYIEKYSYFRRELIKQFIANFILNQQNYNNNNNNKKQYKNNNKTLKIKKNKYSQINHILLQKRINYVYVSMINQQQTNEEENYSNISNQQKCSQLIVMVNMLNEFQLDRIINGLDIDGQFDKLL